MGNEASSTKTASAPAHMMDAGPHVRSHGSSHKGHRSHGHGYGGGCGTAGGCGGGMRYTSAPAAGSCKSGANCHRVAAYHSHPYGMDLAGVNGGLPDALPRDCAGCGTCAGGTCGTACGGTRGADCGRGMCESPLRRDPADAYPDRPVLAPWGQSVRANAFDTKDIRGDPACGRTVKDGSVSSMHPLHFPGHGSQIDARYHDTTHPGRHDQQYSPYGCSFRGKQGCQ